MATAAGRDLIVAAATGSAGAAAVVRCSGGGAFDALRRLCGEATSVSRGVHAVILRLPLGELPCLAACMPGPGSYTGEDTVEWIVPGHPGLVASLVRAVAGSVPDGRMARPGEFTLRAFETGRLTLDQAEGVAASIAARTDAELCAASHLRDGALGREVDLAMEGLADLLALVEAGIDFTDQEDVVAIPADDLRRGMVTIRHALAARVERSVPIEALAATPLVVLSGPANVGKSALFNALLGRERAVVAPVPGTTRDALVEPWRVQGPSGQMELLLVDAPGTLAAREGLDALGQEARRTAMERATIVLSCSEDGNGHAGGDSVIRVRTKSDVHVRRVERGEIATSAVTGEGLDALSAVVAVRASALGACAASEAPALAERHRELVMEAVSHLDAALEAVGSDAAGPAPARPELVSAALHGAIESLGGIRGRLAPDDILGRIFGRFCIGK